MTLTNKDLIYLSVIVILLFIIIYPTLNGGKIIDKNNIDIANSKGKVDILSAQVDSSNARAKRYEAERDSLISLSKKEPKKQKEIEYVYRDKKVVILELDFNESINFSTNWLSKADTL